MANTVSLAAMGNQAAMEATGGMVVNILLPGKKFPEINVVQSIDNSVVDAKKFDYFFGRAK